MMVLKWEAVREARALFDNARIISRTHPGKKIRMHEALNEVYLQTFLGMCVTFHDESNDSN